MKIFNPLSRLVMAGALLLLATASFAQVRGKITDSGDNSPLPGASIVVKGTTKGTLTDSDGQFNLDAKIGETLVVSFVGYEPIEVSAQNDLVLSLKQQSTVLQEVVATALDIKKTKASLGYAVQDVKGSELDRKSTRLNSSHG